MNAPLVSIISGFLVVAAIAVCAVIEKFQPYMIMERLRKRIRFCCFGYFSDSAGNSAYRELIVILNQQALPVYRITEKDYKLFSQLWDEYQRSMVTSFFKSDRPSREESALSKLDDKTFFLVTFFDFLKQKSCDFEIAGNDMFTYICEVSNDTTKYALTDFGVVYYKAYLAAAIFAKSISIPSCDIDGIKGALETHEIEIWRYTT